MDACLPVISRLYRERPGDEILCLFLSNRTAIDFTRARSSVAEITDEIVDAYIWPVGQGTWGKCGSFEELNVWTRKTDKLERALSRWLRPECARRRVVMRHLFGVLEELIVRWVVGRRRATPNHIQDIQGVFTDIAALMTTHQHGFLTLLYWYRRLKDVPHFFLNHGLYVIRDKNEQRPRGRFCIQPSESLWFINHADEVDACIDGYGFKRSRLRAVGVPRHDQSWMKEIIDRERQKDEWSRRGYVLLVSRPAGDAVLPRHRKEKYLQWIHRVVCRERGRELVVKRHPKEVDTEVFEQALGASEQGRSWLFADNHPFVLGRNAELVITFWSGVCVDMIQLGKISIEVNDVRGLEFFDNIHGFRDEDGRAITEYEHFGLVKPAHSEEQLRSVMDRALDNGPQEFAELESNYQRRFATEPDVARQVANEIIMSAS